MGKFNRNLHKELFPKTKRDECFDAMQADDFNPDTVDCYGHDMFDAGADTGVVIGVAAGAAIVGAIECGKRIVRKIKYRRAMKKLEKSINEFSEELVRAFAGGTTDSTK